ncbi:MAG: MerR family DNA-binding transcriptional regulator [Rhodobacterales bacterium]|nr:MerR family DNA-binding transcriptional regulator [Rhodobacterales bacterium]
MDVSQEISIGALSRAVGIPIGTLRTWERRYGYPEPIRRPSGHRRYSVGIIPKLKLVKQLIGYGHKPSTLLPDSDDQLIGRLAAIVNPGPDSALAADRFAHWFASVQKFEADALTRSLQQTWSRVGSVDFLDQHLSPFLIEMGVRWRSNRIDIAEEHFASHVVVSFLSGLWRPITPTADGSVVVCATLPGEHHVIGLHMSAVALSLEGWDVRFVGADTPTEMIGRVVRSAGAIAVAIGTSSVASPTETTRGLNELYDWVDDEVAIWVGGAPSEPTGRAERIFNMSDLLERARHLERRQL